METWDIYENMSAADKDAVHELQTEMSRELGRKVTTAEVIYAIEPSLPTPFELKGY